jgi:hypothetical protein
MDRNREPKQALQLKSKASRNIGRPRKRWKDNPDLKQDAHARLKQCESDWHRSRIKRTLHEELCTFSALSRLPSKGFFWKFRSGTVYTCARSGENSAPNGEKFLGVDIWDTTHVCYKLCKAGFDWSQINRCPLSANIFSHNQHTLCEQFYYVVTSFDPKLGSSSDHLQERECIKKLITLVGDLPLLHYKYI